MTPLEPSLGHPESIRCQETLDRVRTFIADTALPMVAEVEAVRPDTAFAQEADGRLADDMAALKRRMQRASAAAGLYLPHLPEADGGLGLSLVDLFYVQEEVYRHGLRGVQWMLAWTDGPSPLVSHWSAASREEHLPDFLAGRTCTAFAITEPGAGSDALSLETTVRRDGDGWILNGTKHLITGAPFDELAQVVAREEGAGRRELTTVLVPLDAPGVRRGPVQQTLMADGQTGVLHFHDVRLPGHAVVGEVGGGLRMAMLWINWARSRRGGMCSGLARHCLDRSLTYTSERSAFGGPLSALGPVAEMLSDMHMDWTAMRALSLELLARMDRDGLFVNRTTPAMRRDVSTLKTWNDEALYRVADRAIQVHGGRGLLTATGLERIFRVARNLRIPAGASEVQRSTIAESLTTDWPGPTAQPAPAPAEPARPAVDPLVALAAKDPDTLASGPEYRAWRDAIGELSERGDPAVLPLLTGALGSKDEETRADMVWLLGELGDPAAVPALVEAFDASDDRVEKDAIAGALARLDPLGTRDLRDRWRAGTRYPRRPGA